jgi:hypothetical protein
VALRDEQIIPDPDNVNPFVRHPRLQKFDDQARSYTVWIIPEGSSKEGQPNTMIMPKGVNQISLFIRIYIPNKGQNKSGGVRLPAIEAYTLDGADMKPVKCPKHRVLPMTRKSRIKRPRLDTVESGKISFLHMDGSGLLPNPDNKYLISKPDKDKGKLALIRFKAPLSPKRTNGVSVVSGEEDVRYWSMCMSGEILTNTSRCLADFNSRIGPDGYVSILVLPSKKIMEKLRPGHNSYDKIKAKAKALIPTMNFLSWGRHLEPLLIYRNLCTRSDFPYAITKMNKYDPDKGVDWHDFVAEKWLGEYAPMGIQCSIDAFLKDSCDLTSLKIPAVPPLAPVSPAQPNEPAKAAPESGVTPAPSKP